MLYISFFTSFIPIYNTMLGQEGTGKKHEKRGKADFSGRDLAGSNRN